MTDTPEMVDRVAQALASTSLTEKGRATCKWPDDWGPDEVRAYRDEAYAGIAAMREPIPKIMDEAPARADLGIGSFTAAEVWRVMNDAALKGET